MNTPSSPVVYPRGRGANRESAPHIDWVTGRVSSISLAAPLPPLRSEGDTVLPRIPPFLSLEAMSAEAQPVTPIH